MKTLIATLFAGLFVLAAASVAGAGVASADYHGLAAIDASGVAVVAIQSPGTPYTATASENIYLDSNHVFAADEITTVPFTKTVVGRTGMEGAGMYCFDSGGRFCARAF